MGQSLAFCLAVEHLAEVDVPLKACYWRVILLELERLYKRTTRRPSAAAGLSPIICMSASETGNKPRFTSFRLLRPREEAALNSPAISAASCSLPVMIDEGRIMVHGTAESFLKQILQRPRLFVLDLTPEIAAMGALAPAGPLVFLLSQ